MYVTDVYDVKTGSDKITGLVCEWQITNEMHCIRKHRTLYTWCSWIEFRLVKFFSQLYEYNLIVMNTVYHFYDSDTFNPHIGLIINKAEYILFVCLAVL